MQNIFASTSYKAHLNEFRPLALLGAKFTATPSTAEALVAADIPRESVEIVTEIPRTAEHFDIVVANVGRHNQKPRNLAAIDALRIPLIQWAARNYNSVIIIVDALQYRDIVAKVISSAGISEATQTELAFHALSHVALYDEGAALGLLDKINQLSGRPTAAETRQRVAELAAEKPSTIDSLSVVA